MASLLQRIRAFVGGPQGRRALSQARQQLNQPKNRHKLKRLLGKLQSRR